MEREGGEREGGSRQSAVGSGELERGESHRETTADCPLPTAQKFAAYDSKGIWGAGDTAEQARAEAEGFFRDYFADKDDAALKAEIAGLSVAPIGEGLLADLVQFGAGYPDFAIVDGVLVASDEPFSAEEDEAPAPGVEEEIDDH